MFLILYKMGLFVCCCFFFFVFFFGGGGEGGHFKRGENSCCTIMPQVLSVRTELFRACVVVKVMVFSLLGKELRTGLGSTRKKAIMISRHLITHIMNEAQCFCIIPFSLLLASQLCHGCWAIDTFLCNWINQQIETGFVSSFYTHTHSLSLSLWSTTQMLNIQQPCPLLSTVPTKLGPLLFILFLCLFLSLWPFQLYFIP